MTTPLQRYDASRDALLSKSADELAPLPSVAYWSAVRANDRRYRRSLRRRAWYWVLRWIVRDGDWRR